MSDKITKLPGLKSAAGEDCALINHLIAPHVHRAIAEAHAAIQILSPGSGCPTPVCPCVDAGGIGRQVVIASGRIYKQGVVGYVPSPRTAVCVTHPA